MLELIRREKGLLICVALAVVTAAVYWQVSGFGFVHFDDDGYVLFNPHVQGGITLEGLAWAFRTTSEANWHPLTWISLMADSQMAGLSPGQFHQTNVLLHIACALLLYLLLQAMTGRAWPSAFVAALFALHPLHVQSVAWVSERKDVLSTVFWMLTMLAYVRYVRGRDRGRPLQGYALVVVLLALGLMAKPMLVTLPVVLMLMDWWPLRRYGSHSPSPQPLSRCPMSEVRGPRGEGKGTSPQPLSWEERESLPRRPSPDPHPPSPVTCHLVEKLPLFSLAAASCVVTFVVQQRGGSVGTLQEFPMGVRAANGVVAYAAYLVKTVWPARLAVLYPHPGSGIPVWQVVGSAALLALISVAVFQQRWRRPYLLVGWLWYVVTLLPVIGLVQIGDHAMADRYAYVPLIGIFIAIAWTTAELVPKAGTRPARVVGVAAASAVVLAACAASSYREVGYWRNGATLFGRAVEVTSGNYVMHNSLGQELFAEDNVDGAKEQFELALRFRPDYAPAHQNLGAMLLRQGRLNSAIRHLRRAARLDPKSVSARANLGQALLLKQDIDGAIEAYSEAARLGPDDLDIRSKLEEARELRR